MNTNKSRIWMLSVLALAGVLIRPLSANAQCMTVITNGPATATQGTEMYRFIGKSITNGTMCTLTGYNNVRGCNPGMNPPTMTGSTNAGSYVSASALLTQMNPFCAWNCNCGQVVINGASDGLPVELLDFKVSALEVPPPQPGNKTWRVPEVTETKVSAEQQKAKQ